MEGKFYRGCKGLGESSMSLPKLKSTTLRDATLVPIAYIDVISCSDELPTVPVKTLSNNKEASGKSKNKSTLAPKCCQCDGIDGSFLAIVPCYGVTCSYSS